MEEGADRIVYPPLDVPKPFAPGIFVVDSGPHRAFGIPLPVRMTVMALADGGLVLHSPIRLSAGLADALARIGKVRHLIAPNAGHFSYVSEWQTAFPQATTWGAPDMARLLRLRGKRLKIDRTLDDAAPPEWAGEIDQAVVPGAGLFREVVFFHRASRTLILTDLVASLDPDRLPAWLAAGAGAAGATAPRSQAPAYLRAAVLVRRTAARAAMERMLAHRPERAVFAHGTPFEANADERLRRSLSWLLRR